MDKLKILHLNTYSLSGNRSFPHFQMHRHLLNLGHLSHIVSLIGDVEDKHVTILSRKRVLKFIISPYIRWFFFQFMNRNKFSFYYPEWNIDRLTVKEVIRSVPYTPDLIMTYWTKFAFNQKLIFELSEIYGAPVLAMPMDLSLFTGGCHFNNLCNRYEMGCGNCPLFTMSKRNDITRRVWNTKNEYLTKTNISLLLCSSYIMDISHKSSLTRPLKKFMFYYSVDENKFFPGDQVKARQYFKIPKDSKIIFFGAANLNHPRKGMGLLISALEMLNGMEKHKYDINKVFLLIAGNRFEADVLPFPSKHIGYLNTEDELAKAYRACDIFACPSIDDTGPLMINQAIMSGRPVVSFDMGVARDIVIQGRTGYMANLRDAEDFTKGLDALLSLSKAEWKRFSDECRKLAINQFSDSINELKIDHIIRECLKE